jgi:hypothetical protein
MRRRRRLEGRAVTLQSFTGRSATALTASEGNRSALGAARALLAASICACAVFRSDRCSKACFMASSMETGGAGVRGISSASSYRSAGLILISRATSIFCLAKSFCRVVNLCCQHPVSALPRRRDGLFNGLDQEPSEKIQANVRGAAAF